MDYQAVPSLPALFFDQAKDLADKPFLWRKRDGAYRPQSWREVAAAVRALAGGLRSLGVEPGARVALVAENRPEWAIADLAIMAAGGITVPAYTTNTSADHAHILKDSGAVGAIVSTKALARRLLPAASEAPGCAWVIAMEDLGDATAEGTALHPWDKVLDDGKAREAEIAASVARATRGDLACLIYTSGTGGLPKGVMLSHGNILCNCKGAFHLLEILGLEDEVFLSFLPLSHSYEHTAGLHFPISIGAQIYFAEGVDQLGSNLIEARPTIMTAVPRLYETMRQRILRGVEKKGGLSAKLFHRTCALGRKLYDAPDSLTLAERVENAILDRLVRNKVRGRFGGRLKAMVSGGAALNPDVGLFFTALGLCVVQGYGQTEAAPVVSANPPDRIKMHTVGPPLRGVEVKIAGDGEVLVRGELVMQGYWGDAEATRNAIQDGWLHTGDIGEIDEDGYLRITDRKKDIIVLSGGDNVSPARIEGQLTLEPEIAQAMVYGDRRPHLVALLVVDPEHLKTWAQSHGKGADLKALAKDKALNAALSEVVGRVNQRLSSIERPRRFLVAREPFTTENGMMTPTLKIRRHKIKAAYGQDLDALYQAGSAT